MSERVEKICDSCGKSMGVRAQYGGPSVEAKDGALSISFSSYYIGEVWGRNEPPGGDTCSRACAIRMLRVALAYLDPEWRREMEAGEHAIRKKKR